MILWIIILLKTSAITSAVNGSCGYSNRFHGITINESRMHRASRKIPALAGSISVSRMSSAEQIAAVSVVLGG